MALSPNIVLVGHYRFVPEKQAYVGAVASQDESNRTMTVLSIGIEESEFAILEWIKETIALMRSAGNTNVQAPDMFDRARAANTLN